jgi:hypothetical protein
MTRHASVPLLAAVMLAASAVPSFAQDKALKVFMQAKLAHSQRVLEGLVEEDYQKIDKNAQELSLLSLAATWQVLTTSEYVELSRKFRTATDKLAEAAKGKNLNEATKAFHVVTTRCVECHKYLRDVRYASRQPFLVSGVSDALSSFSRRSKDICQKPR